MKIKVPSKTVEVCDVCSREVSGCLLTRCLVCTREFCYICRGIICGCIHEVDVCKNCDDDERVRGVVSKFAKPLSQILKKRDAALSKLVPKEAIP